MVEWAPSSAARTVRAWASARVRGQGPAGPPRRAEWPAAGPRGRGAWPATPARAAPPEGSVDLQPVGPEVVVMPGQADRAAEVERPAVLAQAARPGRRARPAAAVEAASPEAAGKLEAGRAAPA